jgi:hypothetical protein
LKIEPKALNHANDSWYNLVTATEMHFL